MRSVHKNEDYLDIYAQIEYTVDHIHPMIDLTGLWTLLLSSWGLPFLWYSHLFYGRGSLGLNPKQVGAISMKIRVTTYGLTAFYFIKKYTPYTLIQWIPYYQPYRLVGSSACILLGQLLNGAVYKALGFEGVYYCRELGYPARPWIHGFPFIMPHPQYIGSILTVMGAGGWFGIGPDGPRVDILYLTLYVMALYGYAMMFERGSGIHSLKLCKSCGNLLENKECPLKKET